MEDNTNQAAMVKRSDLEILQIKELLDRHPFKIPASEYHTTDLFKRKGLQACYDTAWRLRRKLNIKTKMGAAMRETRMKQLAFSQQQGYIKERSKAPVPVDEQASTTDVKINIPPHHIFSAIKMALEAVCDEYIAKKMNTSLAELREENKTLKNMLRQLKDIRIASEKFQAQYVQTRTKYPEAKDIWD